MSSESSRLCVLHSESSPSLGGQELRILLEMEELSVRGIESVLVARPNTPILVEAKRRGLNAHGIPMRNSFDILSMWKLRRLFRQYRVDVINAHNSKDAWNVSLVARVLGKPVIRARHIGNRVKPGHLRLMIYGPMCDAIVTTGIILLELLRGFVPERAQQTIRADLGVLECVEPRWADYEAAAELSNACRRQGVQLGAVDALLAHLGIAHELTLLTTDRDFVHAAACIPLRVWTA